MASMDIDRFVKYFPETFCFCLTIEFGAKLIAWLDAIFGIIVIINADMIATFFMTDPEFECQICALVFYLIILIMIPKIVFVILFLNGAMKVRITFLHSNWTIIDFLFQRNHDRMMYYVKWNYIATGLGIIFGLVSTMIDGFSIPNLIQGVVGLAVYCVVNIHCTLCVHAFQDKIKKGEHSNAVSGGV